MNYSNNVSDSDPYKQMLLKDLLNLTVSEDDLTSSINFQAGGDGEDGNLPNNNQCDVNRIILEGARDGKYDVVYYMITKGCLTNPSLQDNEKMTLLHYAVRDYNDSARAVEVVNELLKRNNVSEFINIKNKDGNTPLILAVKNENNPLIELLMNKGADETIVNNDGFRVERAPVPTNDTDNLQTGGIIDLVNRFININENKTESSIPDTWILTDENSQTQSGGVDTDQLIEELKRSKLDSSTYQDTQNGGNRIFVGRRKMNGYRESGIKNKKLDTYMTSVSSSEPGDVHFLQRMFKNQSSEIHDRTVTKISELLGVERDVARAYKAALYNKVKENHPELNNLDRALEMEKMATKDVLKKIDITSWQELLEKKDNERKQREQETSEESDEKKSSKKKKKEKKASTKKPKKSDDKEDKEDKKKKTDKKKPAKRNSSRMKLSEGNYSATSPFTLTLNDSELSSPF